MMKRTTRTTTTATTTTTPQHLAAGNVDILGRSEEIAVLLQSFDKVLQEKASHFVTVAGHSGTGKSRLVEALGDRTKNTALYCCGKCEPTRITEPYWVLKDALQGLCITLLTESRWRKQLRVVRKDIEEALGEEGGAILSEVVPELSAIVGEPSSLSSSSSMTCDTLDVASAKDRINYLFRSLFGAITRRNVPLIMFCDDLQWIDASSLEILSWLTCDPRVKSLFIVASYRDNEIPDDHPVATELQQIEARKEKDTFRRIHIKNLSSDEVNALIARMLKLETEETKELSSAVYEKTLGNVFYVLQLLQVLQKEKLLSYSLADMRWSWVPVDRIRYHTDLGDNVVSMIANKLKKLPKEVQRCLMVTSCLSSSINIHVLQTVMDGLGGSGSGSIDVVAVIKQATDEGLLLGDGITVDESVVCRFAHNRIQQAAYSLVSDGPERDRLHFDIGNVLLDARESLPEVEQSLVTFIAPNQLQKGISCIEKEEGFVRLASLHLEAAEKAMSMAAFVSAADYLSKGIDIMRGVDDAWDRHHGLQMLLYQNLAGVSWSSGSPTRSEELVREMLPHAQNLDERLQANHTLALALGSQSRLKEAMDVEVEQLMEMGVLPKRFRTLRAVSMLVNTRKRLKKLSVKDVENLPVSTNKLSNQAMEWLRTLGKHASYRGDKVMQVLVICVMIELALKNGLNDEIFMQFASFGVFASLLFGDSKEGCRLGDMTSALMVRFERKDMLGLVAIWSMLSPWRQPLIEVLEPLLESFKFGMKQGSVETACLCFANYLYIGYLAGLNLGPLLEDAQSHSTTMEQYGIENVLGILQPLRQAMLNLRGDCGDPTILTGDAMDELRFVEEFCDNNLALFSLYSHKMVLYYYFGQYEKADQSLKMAKKVGDTIVFFSDNVQLLMFDALIPMVLARETGRKIYKRRALKGLKVVRRAVTKQGKGMNLAHRLQLLEAQYLALTNGPENDVKTAFNKAVTQSTRTGFRQDAALANLHSGEYFLKVRKDKDWASFYISRSICLFEDWGAFSMGKYLTDKYAGVLELTLQKRLLSTNFHGRSRHASVTSSLFRRYSVSSQISDENSLRRRSQGSTGMSSMSDVSR